MSLMCLLAGEIDLVCPSHPGFVGTRNPTRRLQLAKKQKTHPHTSHRATVDKGVCQNSPNFLASDAVSDQAQKLQAENGLIAHRIEHHTLDVAQDETASSTARGKSQTT